MTAKKAASSSKKEGGAAPADIPTTASPESPAPPLVASYDQLAEAAKQATSTPKKKG